jgi:hypothetical protein
MPKRHADGNGGVFEHRAGFESAYGGMLLEADPAGRSPYRPQLLVNTRLFKNGYARRAPAESYVDLSGGADAWTSFLQDFQIPQPITLYIVGDGCPGISTAVGFFLGTWDPEQQPEFQRALYFNTATTAVKVASYGREVHLSVDAVLRLLNLIPAEWGRENMDVSGVSQDRILHTFASPVVCMQEFDGYLFCGLSNGAASSIWTWDGVSAISDLAGIAAPTCFGIYRDQAGDETLVAGFAAAANHVRSRVKGAPAGTWTTIAPGAGTVSAVGMQRFRDVLYIAGSANVVWSLANATLAAARTLAVGAVLRAITLHNGVLYFAYELAVGGVQHVFVGSFDGATWTDAVIDLTLTKTTLRGVRTLISYRGIFMLGGITASAGAYLYGNAGVVATGASWQTIVISASFSGDVSQFAVL